MGNLRSFLIFLGAVLIVYGGTNYYLYRRVMQASAATGTGAWTLKIAIILLVLAYPLGRALGSGSAVGRPIIWIGSFWLAVLTYGIMLALVVDLVRLGDLAVGYLPNWITGERRYVGQMILAGGAVLIAVLLVAGHIRSLYCKVREVEIVLPRFPEGRKDYRIAFFSDTHLGALVGARWMNRLVDQVNELGADIVIIGGDLLDEPPRLLPWVVEPVSRLAAPDGVWAVTGNHEYYSGVDECVALIQRAGVKVLRDSAVTISLAINLIGLDDITGARQFGEKPKPITDLVAGCDPTLPVVLVHHTPTRLAEAQTAGVDLMISGHTHDGQLWPLGWIAEKVYGVDEGPSRIGTMQFYLSAGAGTWGPPVRVGYAPEILLFTLKPAARDSG